MWEILGIIGLALCVCYLAGTVRLLVQYKLGRLKEWTPVWDIIQAILCAAWAVTWIAATFREHPATETERWAQFLLTLSILAAPWYSQLYKRLCRKAGDHLRHTNEEG